MRRKQRVASILSILSWIGLALPVSAAERHPVSGRQIAPVMGAAGADWLLRAERQQEENPDLAIRLLPLKPGMTVADLGAGAGYYSLRLARIVGPAGKVFATDLQPEMLDLLRKRVEQAGVTNIVPVQGAETGTNLPDSSVDLVLLVDVYHEFSEPRKMLASIARALKPDGKLVLIEFRAEDPKVPIRPEHKMSVAVVKLELEAEGFRLVRVLGDLPWQHLFIFEKNK